MSNTVKSQYQLLLEDTNHTVSANNILNTVLSPFGRITTAEPEHLGNYTGGGLLPQYQYDQRLLGTGATIANNLNENLWELSVDRSQECEAVIQTYKVFEYEAAKGQVVWITAAFGDTNGGVIQEYGYGGGYGDSNIGQGDADGMGSIITDGITLRSENNEITLNLWSSTTGVPVRRTFKREDWDDPLDGTQNCSVNVDFTKSLPIKFTFQYLGVGDIKFYVVLNDRIYLAHTIRNAGLFNKPYMKRGSQPLRARIYSPGGGSGTSTLRYICQGVDRLGGGKAGGTPVTFTNGFTGFSTPNTTNIPYLVYAIRLKDGFNHIAIEPEDGTIVATTNANFTFGFAVDLTLTPALPNTGWEDLFAQNSPVEFFIPQTEYIPTISNKSDQHFWRGTTTQNTSAINPNLGGRQLQLTRRLDGTSQVMLVWIANIGSSRSENYNFDFNGFLSSAG